MTGDLDGLVTGEIEFPDAESALAFEAPDWLGRDVTEDPRYANRTLAVDGIPTWTCSVGRTSTSLIATCRGRVTM